MCTKNYPNIKWLTKSNLYDAINFLAEEFPTDPIYLLQVESIDYIFNLNQISYLYNDDVLLLCAVIIRSTIKNHPLQDGNKRLGIFLGEYFLDKNNIELVAKSSDLFDIAISVAKSEIDKDEIYWWLKKNTKLH